MHQRKTAGILMQKFRGILESINNPEDVHFEIDVFRIGMLHQRVEQGSLGRLAEFNAVRVIAEMQAGARQFFSPSSEVFDRASHVLRADTLLVRNGGSD